MGSRQKLLEDYLDEYISLKGQNRNKFWFDFFGQWWKNYPWKLNDKDEPPVDDPEKMKELALVQPDKRNKKSEVEAAVKTVSFLVVPRGALPANMQPFISASNSGLLINLSTTSPAPIPTGLTSSNVFTNLPTPSRASAPPSNSSCSRTR